MKPQICRDVNNVLPQFETRSCNETTVAQKLINSCNLGQELRDDKKCHFCETNQYRDETTDKCHPCPTSTSPLYALSYKVWHSGQPGDYSLPDFMTTECFQTNYDMEYDCGSNNAWFSTPSTKNYIRTGTASPLLSYMFLTLAVPGFRQRNGGVISFKFEIECDSSDECVLIFMESRHTAQVSQQTKIIEEWNQQTIGQHLYQYTIPLNVSIAFSWIFQRNHSFQSNAKIYEITLTNPMVGSAIKCNPCPHSNVAFCIPCPVGQYLDTFNSNSTEKPHEIESIRSRGRLPSKVAQLCKRCPKNSIINSSLTFPIGLKKSCIECGPGLTDNNGTNCYSDCQLDIDGDKFDLSQMKQPLIYRGGQLFTAGGTPYYHLFNITLCGRPDFKAVCMDNITSFDANDAITEEFGVRSMICRSTILPDIEHSMTAQSVSLGILN